MGGKKGDRDRRSRRDGKTSHSAKRDSTRSTDAGPSGSTRAADGSEGDNSVHRRTSRRDTDTGSYPVPPHIPRPYTTPAPAVPGPSGHQGHQVQSTGPLGSRDNANDQTYPTDVNYSVSAFGYWNARNVPPPPQSQNPDQGGYGAGQNGRYNPASPSSSVVARYGTNASRDSAAPQPPSPPRNTQGQHGPQPPYGFAGQQNEGRDGASSWGTMQFLQDRVAYSAHQFPARRGHSFVPLFQNVAPLAPTSETQAPTPPVYPTTVGSVGSSTGSSSVRVTPPPRNPGRWVGTTPGGPAPEEDPESGSDDVEAARERPESSRRSRQRKDESKSSSKGKGRR